jgi:hypothetical protein
MVDLSDLRVTKSEIKRTFYETQTFTVSLCGDNDVVLTSTSCDVAVTFPKSRTEELTRLLRHVLAVEGLSRNQPRPGGP